MTQDATAPAHDLSFQTNKTAEETVVVCTGKIISETHDLLLAEVRPLIPETKRIVLDLTNVSYVDSSGMGALVQLWVRTKRENCEFRIINLNERIKDLLRISNLAKILEGDQEYHKYLGA
jgi:anti-sigma B factor antagonist